MAIDKSLKEDVVLYLDVLDIKYDEFLDEVHRKFLEEHKKEFQDKVRELNKIYKERKSIKKENIINS